MSNVLKADTSNQKTVILRCISALTELAGLLHDTGKASDHFQKKLTLKIPTHKEAMRHERLSCTIWSSLYEELITQNSLTCFDDADFFHALANCSVGYLQQLFLNALKTENLKKHYSENENSTIQDLTTSLWNNEEQTNVCLFNAVYFLILSHHKLPLHNQTEICEKGYINTNKTVSPISFSSNTPFENPHWLKKFQQLCLSLSQPEYKHIYQNIAAFTSAIVYIARPTLVISDQLISHQASAYAKTMKTTAKKSVLYANSYKDENGQRQMAQPLTEHLLQVSQRCATLIDSTLHTLQDKRLPTLKKSPKQLTDPAQQDNFLWQNTAQQIITSLPESGNLIIICSETGSGKTLANIKVASALRKHQNIRLTTLLGMNTLTRQTATHYITDSGLKQATATITGHAITRHHINQIFEASSGCENLDDSDYAIAGPSSFKLPADLCCPFQPKYDQILAPPVLVATIDHLIQAVQSGKSTKSRLLQRLQSTDLIIDEIDSYHSNSLVPVYKLVYLAGFFNRNIIVSTATLRPAVAHTLAESFKKGLDHNNSIFGTQHQLTGAVISNLKNCSFITSHAGQFTQIIEQQRKASLHALKAKPAKRRLKFIDASNARDMLSHAKRLHQAHNIHVQGIKFSAGILRLNNIKYVQAFACRLSQLSDEETEIAVICYHSRIGAPVRYQVENCLDNILKRKNTADFKKALLKEPEFQRTLQRARSRNVNNIMLLIVSSPIVETGRDHDVDYAITEPCSHHSLIQLSGRVRRHRKACDLSTENVLMLKQSLKEQHEPTRRPYLSQPGAETKHLTLCQNVSIEEAFSCEHVDYTQGIDSRACLIDYPLKPAQHNTFFNLNELEVQHVINARNNIREFINHADTRLTASHAKKFPLRDNTDDIPVWYNGTDWVMPAYQNTPGNTCLKTEPCNWQPWRNALPALWFNQDIDSLLSGFQHDPMLVQLLTSPHSHFLVSRHIHHLPSRCFSPALGVFNAEDMTSV